MNKKFVILLSVTAIALILIAIILLKTNILDEKQISNTISNEIESSDDEEAHIDLWRDNTMDGDIDLYSRGTGDNKEIYLGAQSIHYLISKNGEIKSSQPSSFMNEKTREIAPPKEEYLKTLNESELKNLEEELKSVIKNKSTNSVDIDSQKWYLKDYWFIKIDGEKARVQCDVYSEILSKYL